MNGDIHLAGDICILESLLPEEKDSFLLQRKLINGIVQQGIIILDGNFFFFCLDEMPIDGFLFLSHLADLSDCIQGVVPGNDKKIGSETFQLRK